MKKVTICILTMIFISILAACNPLNDGAGDKTIEFVDSGDTPIASFKVGTGALIDEPTSPTFLDYEFGGWYEDSRYTKSWDFETSVVKSNTKLYAKWSTKITQTVSILDGLNSQNEPVYKKETIETTMRVNPRVVVTFALEIADIFKVVGFENTGITYFGLPKSNLPESINMFAGNSYPNTGTLFEPNYDTLDLMMPDLIIIGGRSANLHDTLKTKYPNADILDVSNSNFSFEKQTEVFEALKQIFPKISDTILEQQTLIQTKLVTLQAKVTNENALFLQVNGGQISVFGAGSRYGVMYNEFKFLPSDPGQQTLEAHGNIVTFEYVSQVNPQVLFLMDRSAAIGSSGAIDQIMSNALIKNTVAGKNDDIYILSPSSWYILPGGIESTLQMIDDIEQLYKN